MDVEIKGLDEVLAKLAKLDDEETKNRLFGKAAKAGGQVILDAAQPLAPTRSGLLKSNIQLRSRNRPSKGSFRTSVGVGEKDWTGPTFYASFVLFGHRVGSRKLGDKRTQVPENNFLRRAAETAGEQAAQAMIESIGAALKD